jgi:hypothetical protein
VVFSYDEGTDVFAAIEVPARGAPSEGLRILRSRAEGGALHLTLEGLAGRTYPLGLRSPQTASGVAGVAVTTSGGRPELRVTFDGPDGAYVRRTIDLPLR